jgi:hypothetical protein
MKTPMIKAMFALCTVTAVGSAFAAAGYTHPTEGYVPSRSRAEVVSELRDAYFAGSSGTSMRDGDDSNVGARGPAGKRYSMRTREEVQAELADWKKSDAAAFQKSLYFGD